MELIRATAVAVVEDYSSRIVPHECAFDKDDRRHLHELADAIKDEGANRETHIIIFRIGNGVRNVTRKIAQALVWAVIVGAGAILLFAIGRGAGPR